MHSDSMPQATSSTMLIRTATFLDVGGYDESMHNMYDWHLLLRLRAQHSFAYVPEPLVLYRRHGTNLSRNVQLLARESKMVLDMAFGELPLPDKCRRLRRSAYAWNALVLAGSYLHSGRWGRALLHGIHGALLAPLLAMRRLGGWITRESQRLPRRDS
jgi:hypothetical protein